VTLDGRFHQTDDLVLLPPPARRVPIMIGSNGPRMLGIALPHADAWNTWYDDYGNSVEGFEALNTRISEAARSDGREPDQIARSACVLVTVGDSGERPADPAVPAVPVERLEEHLAGLSRAGADEAILVVDPITETSIARLAPLLG
jgi:alkanesulfonate monooxygenase SsuD/methylene tetrahydromethanopterin reductase-like flavin-dependent oxidoreductase (luciferase family)